MSKNNIIIAIALVALFAFAISPLFMAGNLKSHAPEMQKQMNKVIPQKEANFSKQYFALLQARDLETAKKYLDPKIVDAQFQQKFDELVSFIPSETAKSVKVIGAHTHNNNGIITTSVSSEYEFSSKWLLANITLQNSGDTYLVQGMNVEPLADSLENLTQFEFAGKSVKHYVVFTVAVLLLLFNLYVLALCIKTPVPRRKWLWVIFILVGVCAVNFNWTSGGFFFQPLMFKFPVVQFSQMLYQPFFVTITIPFGAILFLRKRKKWRAQML